MHKLYYQPDGFWFGDCMPFGKDDTFYLFHQRDNRNPEPFGEPFGWALATTDDFIEYKDFGESLKKGSNIDQDQFIFAGSIFQAKGKYHAFYTGYNRDYPKQGRASQVLLHAESEDLINWKKTEKELGLGPQDGYDQDDWRDPFVIWLEEKQEYLLILGARKIKGKKKLNGCTVSFTSTDLENWEFNGEFWAPDIYTMHEMPDLFKIGDWWYLIISEYSDKNKIVYRMSKSLDGPWIAPVDDAFDGRAYYAGRTFQLKDKRILFGWVPTKEDEDDKGNFEWGGTFVAHEIYQRKDGSLGTAIPESVWNAFGSKQNLPDFSMTTLDSKGEKLLNKKCGDIFCFQAKIKIKKGTRNWGLKFYNNEETDEGYQFIFPVNENKYYFEAVPNQPWYQCMNIGLERPFFWDFDKTYDVKVIVDDTIATIYIDGVALNTRQYRKPGDSLSLFVTDGSIEVKNIIFSNTLKKNK